MFALIFVGSEPWLHGSVRAVAGYDGASLFLLLFLWAGTLRPTPEGAMRRAESEDPGRNVVMAAVLISAVYGLVAAITILGRGPEIHRNSAGLELGFGLAAVILGWLVIHTIFTLRYAYLYYVDDDDDGEAQRGLTFPGTTDPGDYDFAYFSFVVGMTFQVSDVEVSSRVMRRVVLLHGLVSFAYNTTILALVVNVVSGILSAK